MITAKEVAKISKNIIKEHEEALKKEIEKEHLDCLEAFEKALKDISNLYRREFYITLTRAAAKQKEELGFKVTSMEAQTHYRTSHYKIEW